MPTLDTAPDALARAAAGLVSLTVDPVQAGAIDLVASGAIAPDAEVSIRTGAAEAGKPPAAGEPVALRDLEGVLLAVLLVASAEREDGSLRLRGALTAARRPDRPDYPQLRPAAAEVRDRLRATGGSGEVTALVEELPPTPAGFAAMLAAAGGRLLALALAPGAPDDPDHHARVRAWLRVAEPYGDAVTLVLVPASLPADPELTGELRALLATAYGAATVAPSPTPDPAAVAPAASGGATVLLTGLSGSGKSTIAGRLLVRLMAAGRSTSMLDGDVVRTHLSKGLGFSRADRDTNVRRIGFVAAEITKHGGIAIAAPIAPYDETRRAIRAMVERYGAFVLVHVDTPLEVCEARDRKGLYAKARAGEIPEFTGISDPYEVPLDADLVVDTRTETADEAADRILGHLRAIGAVPPAGGSR
ncbi:MAG: adenylyl-sulfate kinase [Frankiaceae bacterium]